MNAFARLALATFSLLSATAFAQFSWDASTASCRNAAGERGFNVGLRGPCGDFAGQSLAGARFESLDLRGARFDGADLTGASFLHSNLTGASFREAKLTRATLRGAQVLGAHFDGANLVRVSLEQASLSGSTFAGADLRNACLFRARFDGADVRGAQFSNDRAMITNARWSAAIVSTDTLPLSSSELATLGLIITGQVAAR